MKDFLFFALGASLGSFFGLVIDRFPEASILFPASHCNHCKKPLAFRDLIPILSQLANRFRCRFCQTKVTPWYGLIELICGLLCLFTSQGFLSIGQVLVAYTGLVLAIYDCKTQTYPLMIWLISFSLSSLLLPWTITTAVCILLAGLAQLGKIPMGSGDFLFMASLSLVLPLQAFLWLLQMASLAGMSYCIFRQTRSSIPFIPFLTTAFFIILVLRF
ncbi:prepilin peptidase [Streptococcus ovuberis]|uniref:Prepilin peptidase n=1 Tax=Streptococcus ovuberis TaxID=1936207 RepID=A0A7X6MXV4_9STRE|nr:A24 family peptidase [Streptococcus ovuberis]NKZ20382.1 prepilin peptidase [Streptococcus ovuberis]